MTGVLVRHLIVAGVIVVLALVGIALAGWSPRVEYIAALGFLFAVASAGLQRLGTSVAEWRSPSPVPPTPGAPGVDPRIAALETLLRRSTEDAGTFRRRLRVLLADLATHRLERDHGIDPVEYPDEARQLLGEDAWRILTADQRVTTAGLDDVVSALERLPRMARPT
jgi:hypothetical protein